MFEHLPELLENGSAVGVTGEGDRTDITVALWRDFGDGFDEVVIESIDFDVFALDFYVDPISLGFGLVLLWFLLLLILSFDDFFFLWLRLHLYEIM